MVTIINRCASDKWRHRDKNAFIPSVSICRFCSDLPFHKNAMIEDGTMNMFQKEKNSTYLFSLFS